MRRDWGELNARARGLTTRLLDRGTLERLAGLEAPASVARELAGRGRLAEDEGIAGTLPSVEREMRRGAARRLRLLQVRARGTTLRALSVLFQEEDVRSLRKLLRGAASSATPEARSAGLLPTPSLADEDLERLSRADDPGDLVRKLADIGHPLASPLTEVTGTHGPELALLETALLGGYLERSRRDVPRGNPRLRAHVARRADLANAWSCLFSTGEKAVANSFLAGGAHIDRDLYVALCRQQDPERRRRAVGEALGADAGGRLVADPSVPLSELEGRTLAVLAAEERNAARSDPLSAAPLLHFVLAQRVELQDLRRVLWGIRLGAPASALRRRLVTA